MDRYDAILEHLKEAQRRSRDSVASHLDAVVTDLERVLENAKSAVQEAVPTTGEELLPIAEVEAVIAELRSQPTTPEGVSLDNLRVLDQARSQSELLRALLPMMSAHAGRAAVLVIREGIVTAWSGSGFGDPEALRSWHGAVDASPELASLAETSQPRQFSPGDDPLFSQWLADQSIPGEAVLLPISLRGKLMGMVYLDHSDDQPWDVESAQVLNAIACLLIDTLHHRNTVPSPTLAPVEEQVVPKAAATDEVFAEAEAAEPEEEIAEIEFEPESYEETSVEEELVASQAEEAVELDYDFGVEAIEEPTADAGFDPSATIRVEADTGLPEAEGGFEPQPEPAAQEPITEAEPSGFGETMETPPPVRPVEPPPVSVEEEAPDVDFGRSPEEEAKLEEARRFARLLVSEIKLYNEEDVEKGRAAKDLGERLKEDIERSREMYEKRISQEIRQQHDYFHDELVRILADGDDEALGG
jgi:hypothetical protein